MLALSKKNFEKIFFQEFRQIGQEIQNNALKRRERVRKRYKEALAYCLNEANQPKEPIEHTKSLTDANNTTLSSPSNLGPIDNKFSKSAESGDIRKKNPFFAKKLMDIASKIRATTQPGTQTPVGSDTDSKADSNTEEQKFRSGFKVENLVDVVRTPKRRNSMHHASTAEIINSDRPHNSDHEGKSPKTKKTMLSSFSSYANKLKNDAQNSDSTPVKDNGELIEINENKSEGSHAKMWGKLNGLLHPDGKSKLQKSFSTKNVMKPILPDKKDLLFKNQNASKFVSLLDMKLKKKKINVTSFIFLKQ